MFSVIQTVKHSQQSHLIVEFEEQLHKTCNTDLLSNFMPLKIPWKNTLSSATKWAAQRTTYLNYKSKKEPRENYQQPVKTPWPRNFLLRLILDMESTWDETQAVSRLEPFLSSTEYQQFQSICYPPVLSITAWSLASLSIWHHKLQIRKGWVQVFASLEL